MSEQKEKKHFEYIPQITLGNIISVGSMVLTILYMLLSFNTDVATTSAKAKQTYEEFSEFKAQDQRDKDEIKDLIKEQQKTITTVSETQARSITMIEMMNQRINANHSKQ